MVSRTPAIAIIGAGPAGSAAAFHLARAGLPVTILEARAFPRTKVCGEFISPAATHLLEAILPPDTLRAAGARRVDAFVLQLGTRQRTLRMPSPAWALSRRTLDDLLLERARAAGASVLQPAPVARVDHGQSPPGAPAERPCTIHLADGERLIFDLVLHADGHGRFCPAPPTPAAPGLIAHKCHFIPATPITGVTIRSARGAYLGTVQVEPDANTPSHATLALVARKQLLAAHQGDIDSMVRSLWPSWNQTMRASPWLSSGVARAHFQSSGHPNAFRLGNAAAAVDPVGGEGIGLGLWSGTTLANLLVGALARPRAADSRSPRSTSARTNPASDHALDADALAQLHRRYATLYRRRLLTRRPACQLAAEALTHPRLIAALWPLLTFERFTLAPWYAATGKPWRPPRSSQPAT